MNTRQTLNEDTKKSLITSFLAGLFGAAIHNKRARSKILNDPEVKAKVKDIVDTLQTSYDETEELLRQAREFK